MRPGGLLLWFLAVSCSGCVRTGNHCPCAPDLAVAGDAAPFDSLPGELDVPTAPPDLLPHDLLLPDAQREHYLRFDSTGDYIRVDAPMSWAANFTVSVQIRLIAAPGSYTDYITGFASVGGGLGSGWEMGFETGSKPRLWVSNHDTDPWPNRCEKTAAQPLPTGQWRLMTFVFDYASATSIDIKLYVDDTLRIDMSSPGMGGPSCSATITPGALPSIAFRLGGQDSVKLDADDLRVFDRALGPTDVALLSGGTVPPGLILHWNMNEGSGTTVHDTSGHGRTGTVNNPDWRLH